MNKKLLPEPCLVFPEDKMQEILNRLDAKELEKYKYLQEHVFNCEINRDRKYKSVFRDFYWMKMPLEYQTIFFDILEREKRNGLILFDVILNEIYENIGRREVFLCSIIVHTVNPSMPIWNKNLIYDLSLKGYYDSSRGLDPYNKTYSYIKTWTEMAIKDSCFKTWVNKFDEFFPDFRDFTAVKKLDLFFWKKYKSNMHTRKQVDDIMHRDKGFFVRPENLISESGNKKSPHQALNNYENTIAVSLEDSADSKTPATTEITKSTTFPFFGDKYTRYITNRANVDKALYLLKRGISAYILREITGDRGNVMPRDQYDNIVRNIVTNTKAFGDNIKKHIPPRFHLWDISPLIALIIGILKEFNDTRYTNARQVRREFPELWDNKDRFYSLRKTRNKWAHQKPFSDKEMHSMLVEAEKLLIAIGATRQAKEIRRMQEDIVIQMYRKITEDADS